MFFSQGWMAMVLASGTVTEATYRVGKANPSILNNVMVDYYGIRNRH
jgi:ribosome recycling factor